MELGGIIPPQSSMAAMTETLQDHGLIVNSDFEFGYWKLGSPGPP